MVEPGRSAPAYYPQRRITGWLLAGGHSRRLGGRDKGLLRVGGQTMIEYAIRNIQPFTANIGISANQNLTRYAFYGSPVFPDEGSASHGPMSGIRTGLNFTRKDFLLVMGVDHIGVPGVSALFLYKALRRHDAEAAVLCIEGRPIWTAALLRARLRNLLPTFGDNGDYRLGRWFESRHTVYVHDPFPASRIPYNINNPDQLRRARAVFRAAKMHESKT